MRIAQALWLAVGLSTLACSHRPTTADARREADVMKQASKRAFTALRGVVASTAPMVPTADMDAANELEASPQPAPAAGRTRDAFSLGWADDPTVMIIRTGTASIRIDSLETALAQLRTLSTRVGGYVANTQFSAGSDQYRQATLEIKVPAEHFDDLVAGLQPLGKLESVNVTAEDVSEEYVDINARVANSKRLESRLIDLLATRTGRLQDVLTVERELARVREEIERYEGRLRYLKSRSAMSSLSITIHEPVPIGGAPENVLVRAFERAWHNFVELAAGFIASLGVLVPLVVAGGTVVWGVRRLRRPATVAAGLGREQ